MKINKDALIEDMMRCQNDDDLFHWFKSLNKQYRGLKKKNELTEQMMIELSDFWAALVEFCDEDFFEWLIAKWGQIPPLIQDIVDFGPERKRIEYEKFTEKMDGFELSESTALFDEIWKRGQRVEVTCAVFDWDTEEELSMELTVPRDDREDYEYDLRWVCAMMVYNRGNMILRFFAGRGNFELVGIKAFNGRGKWECLTEQEIESGYETGLAENETVIFFNRDTSTIPRKGNLLFMPKR